MLKKLDGFLLDQCQIICNKVQKKKDWTNFQIARWICFLLMLFDFFVISGSGEIKTMILKVGFYIILFTLIFFIEYVNKENNIIDYRYYFKIVRYILYLIDSFFILILALDIFLILLIFMLNKITSATTDGIIETTAQIISTSAYVSIVILLSITPVYKKDE